MANLLKTLLLIFILLSQNSILLAQQDNLVKKVETSFNKEDYQDVISSSEKILARAEEKKDTTSALLLYFLGDSYLALDQTELAYNTMEKELFLRKELYPEGNLEIADIHFYLASFYFETDKFDKTIHHYKSAAALYKKFEGEESQAYVLTNIELMNVYSLLSDYSETLKLIEHLYNNPTARNTFWLDINKALGNTYKEMGQFSKAITTLENNLDYAKTHFGKESMQYIESLIFLGDLYSAISEFGKSERLYKEALVINNKINASYEIKKVIYNNLGILYLETGLYNEAYETLLKSKDSDHYFLLNMGKVYAKTDSIEKSDLNYQKALTSIENSYDKNSIQYANALKEKAIFSTSRKDISHYISELNESTSIASNFLSEANPEYSKYEFQLGQAYFRNNDIKAAENHLHKAYDLRKNHLNTTHPLFAEASKEMAELRWQQKNTKAAEKYYKETFTNYFKQIDTYFPALSEQEKANFYSNILRPTFEEFNSFAIANHDKKPSLLDDMYNYQLATKGLIMYATSKARETIISSGNKELIDKYNNWLNTKELISKLYSLSSQDVANQPFNLDSLTKKANEIEKELSRSSYEFADAYSKKRISWKEVQSQLKKGEVAVELIRFKKFSPDSSGLFLDQIYYAALLIDNKSKNPELILFENGEELENKFINNYKNAIKYKAKDQYSYEKYWKPIALKTKKYNKIYFSPDGIYNQISINTLYNNESEKYVLEEQNILILTNTKDILASANSNKTNNLALNQNPPQLFGFPNYNKGLEGNSNDDNAIVKNISSNVSMDRGLRGSLQRYIRGNSLVTSLPGTKEEVEQIEKIYKENNLNSPGIHLANEADESSLKNVKSPRILHIATHGFFLEDNESSSGLSDSKYAQNPLLKSGLIMAGANSFLSTGMDENVGQDGILTAYEAMNMDLKNTELIVLSACETGLGDLKNGEGVYGLRRAFQVAGAKTILMSLWAVDDLATKELMTEFYDEWLSGKSKQEAFKKAQLSLKEKYQSPYYWGAFVMVGE